MRKFLVAVLLSVSCNSVTLHAQTPAQVIASFPASTQATLKRLGDLDHLPGGAWRYHVADMAHGEDPELDDSKWPTAEGGRDLSTQALWFRRWIEVPVSLDGYDLTGSAVWFHASIDAHMPLTQIIYVNGRRIAMGDNIEPVELVQHVKAGEKMLVAVKALATVLPKRFNGTQITIRSRLKGPTPSICAMRWFRPRSFCLHLRASWMRTVRCWKAR